MWEGRPKHKCTVVAYGKLGLRDYPSGKRVCKLLAGSAQIRLYFFGGVVPPHLRDDDTVIVVGRMATFNQGRNYNIWDCIVIKDDQRRAFRLSFHNAVERYAHAPKLFMDLPERYRR